MNKFTIYVDGRKACTIWAFDEIDAIRRATEGKSVGAGRIYAVPVCEENTEEF